jgi:hypothetical protein
LKTLVAQVRALVLGANLGSEISSRRRPVHLRLSEPRCGFLAGAIRYLKLSSAKRLGAGGHEVRLCGLVKTLQSIWYGGTLRGFISCMQ